MSAADAALQAMQARKAGDRQAFDELDPTDDLEDDVELEEQKEEEPEEEYEEERPVLSKRKTTGPRPLGRDSPAMCSEAETMVYFACSSHKMP